ncbi:hypothetical protein K3G39_04795 [Pontibacter sp. HSC-14F20]|uniref:hypothetical protein n=1 Tax=Pontibacter sp. HSC-14F20 TaxID=2864136 RepID=UPI001C7321A7|nr:hypothetical protein [Pontibacter sp. HSC-14F20]MBX0332550.1 hypothetical protein [Pontibacter sp. HSC-14F20]
MDNKVIESLKRGIYKPISPTLVISHHHYYFSLKTLLYYNSKITKAKKNLRLLDTTYVKHKYTFQDWLHERFPLEPIEEYQDAVYLPSEEYDKIYDARFTANQNHINNGIISLKNAFVPVYNISAIPDKILDYAISIAQERINQIESKDVLYDIRQMNLYSLSTLLTAKQTRLYLNANIESDTENTEYEIALSNDLDEDSAYSYVVYSAYLKWLMWFKEDSKSKQPQLFNVIPEIDSYKVKTELLEPSSDTKQKVIALFHFYNGDSISLDNCEVFAAKYEYKSGRKLYQHFGTFCNKSERIGRTIPFTKTKMRNKAKLIENAIQMLPEHKRELAICELEEINMIIENELF